MKKHEQELESGRASRRANREEIDGGFPEETEQEVEEDDYAQESEEYEQDYITLPAEIQLLGFVYLEFKPCESGEIAQMQTVMRGEWMFSTEVGSNEFIYRAFQKENA